MHERLIPGLQVIDSCRTLQPRWHRVEQRSEARIVWASKSQCEQRKGEHRKGACAIWKLHSVR